MTPPCQKNRMEARSGSDRSLSGECQIIWGCLWALGYQLIPPETFGATIGIAGICLVAAWVAIFVIQFVSAPPRLYTKLKRELDWLKGARKPELRVTRF